MRQREALRGLAWRSLGIAINGLLTLLYPWLLIKWIGREPYGVVSYLLNLLNYSYLLTFGLAELIGQRLAASFTGVFPRELLTLLRAAMGLIGLNTAIVGLLWFLVGPQTLGRALALSPSMVFWLSQNSLWVPPAVWGIQIATLLYWIPIALRHYRLFTAFSLASSFWQNLFPLLWLALARVENGSVALQGTLIGQFGLGLTLYGLTKQALNDPLWPIAPFPAWRLFPQGVWVISPHLFYAVANALEGLFIARWISLDMLGLYNAVFFLNNRINLLSKRLTETFLPFFGSLADSPLRRALRVGQVTWVYGLGWGLASFSLWAAISWLLAALKISLSPLERLLLIAAFGASQLAFPLLPLNTYYQSQGKFRTLALQSLFVHMAIIISQPLLLHHGLMFWSTLVGGIVGAIYYYIEAQTHYSERFLWKVWILPSLVRRLGVWAIGAGIYFHWPAHIGTSFNLLGLGVTYGVMEILDRTWPYKLGFLKALRQTLLGLAKTHVGRLLRPARKRPLNDR
ncbi:MAG: hypothetical protein NZ958_02690 [Bacteroidia bacterium]|nr:hypothetical protein [Bacteroidia bacterium]MDW8089585.1 hypothetical protein [Bacteroidia bacterium]